MKGGHSGAGITLFSGSVNAIIPGRKLGKKRSTLNHLSGIPDKKWPSTKDVAHKPSNVQRVRPRHKNKKGRNKYICSSIGSVQSGITAYFEPVRFCTSARFENTSPKPGLALRLKPCTPPCGCSTS